MLETIREFAADRLEASGRGDELRSRHLAFFVELARVAVEAKRDDVSAYMRMLAPVDRDNYRAALDFAEASGRVDELLDLTAYLVEFWRLEGDLEEGLRRSRSAVARGTSADSRRRGRVEYAVALFTYIPGHVAETVEHVDRAIELLEDGGRPDELGRACWLRGACANTLGDPDVGRSAFERAVELLADDEILGGRVRAGLAESHRLLGDLETAQRLALESAEMAARVGDDEFHAFALVHVGYYAIARSDLAAARESLATTLEIGERIGDPWTSAVGLLFVADVARIDADEERAARLIGASRAAYDEIGPGRWEAEREHWEPLLDALETELGADRLSELQREGAELSLDAAVALGRTVVES
jgi:hypothetical protein